MERSIEEIKSRGEAVLRDYCSDESCRMAKKALIAWAESVTDPNSENYDDMALQELIEIDDCLFESLVASKVIAFVMGYKAAMKDVKTLIDKSL